MKISHHSKDIRKLFEVYGEINKYHRRHIAKNYRESQMSGYAIIQGSFYLFCMICGLGFFLWIVPIIGRM